VTLADIDTNERLDALEAWDRRYRPILHALVGMIAAQCDGARESDGVGFDGTDTVTGCRLARLDASHWNAAASRWAHGTVRKYAGQLDRIGIPRLPQACIPAVICAIHVSTFLTTPLP